MGACYRAAASDGTLSAMISTAVRHPRRHGPRLFERPMLFRRTRRNVAQLVGLVWLAAEIVRLARSRRS
jgi:hypothetical protein